MRRQNFVFCSITLLFTFFSILSITFDCASASDVNLYFGIDTGGPPRQIIEGSTVILIPETSVYYISYYDEPLYFYSGYWYRVFDGLWYRGISHRGPWHHIHHRYVPYVIINLPVFYGYKHKFHDGRWHQFKHREYWHRERNNRYH